MTMFTGLSQTSFQLCYMVARVLLCGCLLDQIGPSCLYNSYMVAMVHWVVSRWLFVCRIVVKVFLYSC